MGHRAGTWTVRWGVGLGLCMALLAAGGCAPGLALVEPSQILRAFDDAAFGAGRLGPDGGRVTKWATPLRIHFLGTDTSGLITEIDRVAARLRGLTGLSITRVRAPGGSNVEIFLEDDAAFLAHLARHGIASDAERRARVRNGDCWSVIWVRGHQVERGAIFISGRSRPADPVGRINRCLGHEMVHVLGLPGHVSTEFSILDHSSSATQYTQIDRALLRTLYHPAMVMGLERRRALALTDPAYQR